MTLPPHAQRLHGTMESDGATVVGIDSDSQQPLDWSGMFVPGHAHLILNLDGYGVVLGENIRLSLFPGMTAICRVPSEGKIYASRLPGSGRHRCVVLTVSDRWLSEKFGHLLDSLHPLFHEGTPAPAAPQDIGLTRSMSLAEKDMCSAMMTPPVVRSLRPMWFRAKLVECMSLFGHAAPVSSQPKEESIRLRIEKAILWLREHFEEDLDLKALSVHAGCAPHYLSRLFRQHTGKTLTQKLRQIRIDHAAELLQNGTHNVTEAALEVGYHSISHFTKAFLLEKGILPSQYRHS